MVHGKNNEGKKSSDNFYANRLKYIMKNKDKNYEICLKEWLRDYISLKKGV